MNAMNELPRVSVLGTRLTVSSLGATVEWLGGAMRERRSVAVSAATVYSVMLAHGDAAYRACVNSTTSVVVDGMPLVWALRLLGHPAQQVNGDDLMLATCARFPERRHFLLGGTAGQPQRAAEELRRRFADIQIVGTHATPVRPLPEAERERVVAMIRDADAEVVWVGMGTPAQDVWMVAHTSQLRATLVGVGSTFDLLIGRKQRAPLWMRRSGLEWAYRLAQEPRRLARRYLLYNPLFVWHFTSQLIGVRKY